jgi:rhomboid protease GluP
MDPDSQPSVSAMLHEYFTIEYQLPTASLYNAEFKGTGELTIVGAGGTFTFAGRKRSLFSKQTLVREFSHGGISNVSIRGRAFQFSTKNEKGVPNGTNFVFFARDERDAAAIAARLPSRVDEDFSAGLGFYEQLRRLPRAMHPLTSATNIIIALNVAVFLVMTGFLGAGWFDVTDMEPYIRFGANNGAATTDGEWWRLLTSMFMHFGFMHLAFNMWALYQSGHLVERLQGRTLFWLTYLGSGLGGGFASLAWNGDRIWSVGASGAIFGVYGALLGYMLREKQSLPSAVFRPMMRSTLLFAGYNLVFGVVNSGIDNAAHVGGLLTGVALGWITAPPLDLEERSAVIRHRISLAAGMIAVMVFAGVTATPRYDYSVSEDIALRQALNDFPARETELLKQLRVGLDRWFGTRRGGDTLLLLVDEKLVPLYTEFQVKIDSLPLSEGRRTGSRRKALDHYVQLRLESFRHLDVALKSYDLAQYKAFDDLTAQAGAVLQPLEGPSR